MQCVLHGVAPAALADTLRAALQDAAGAPPERVRLVRVVMRAPAGAAPSGASGAGALGDVAAAAAGAGGAREVVLTADHAAATAAVAAPGTPTAAWHVLAPGAALQGPAAEALDAAVREAASTTLTRGDARLLFTQLGFSVVRCSQRDGFRFRLSAPRRRGAVGASGAAQQAAAPDAGAAAGVPVEVEALLTQLRPLAPDGQEQPAAGAEPPETADLWLLELSATVAPTAVQDAVAALRALRDQLAPLVKLEKPRLQTHLLSLPRVSADTLTLVQHWARSSLKGAEAAARLRHGWVQQAGSGGDAATRWYFRAEADAGPLLLLGRDPARGQWALCERGDSAWLDGAPASLTEGLRLDGGAAALESLVAALGAVGVLGAVAAGSPAAAAGLLPGDMLLSLGELRRQGGGAAECAAAAAALLARVSTERATVEAVVICGRARGNLAQLIANDLVGHWPQHAPAPPPAPPGGVKRAWKPGETLQMRRVTLRPDAGWLQQRMRECRPAVLERMRQQPPGTVATEPAARAQELAAAVTAELRARLAPEEAEMQALAVAAAASWVAPGPRFELSALGCTLATW